MASLITQQKVDGRHDFFKKISTLFSKYREIEIDDCNSIYRQVFFGIVESYTVSGNLNVCHANIQKFMQSP